MSVTDTPFGGHAPLLSGGGEMGALIRSQDWSGSPLGKPETWSQTLRSALQLCLDTPHVSAVHWGSDLCTFYNDAYAHALAERHPSALGQPLAEVWPELWDVVEPQITTVLETGRGVSAENQLLRMRRRGQTEDTFWTYSFAPLYDAGAVSGIFVTAFDTTDKVRSERRLAEGRDRQRSLFDQAPGFITILGGPELRFEFVNQAYDRLFGHRGFVGRTVREVFPDLEGQPFFELLDKAYATGERFVARATPIRLQATPDAEPADRFLDFIYEPVRDEAGRTTGIFVEGYDVTDAHVAQDALRESERRYRTLFENIDEGFCIVEFFDGPHGPLSDYLHIAANPAYERHAGITNIVGKTGRAELTPDEAEEWLRLLRGVLVTGQPIRFERDLKATGRHLDLACFRVEPAEKPQIAIVFQDVTARKRAETALRTSEEFNRRVLQSSADCIKVLSLDANIEFMSEGGMCVMEVDDFGAIEGACWPDFWPGEGREKAEAAVEAAKRGGTGRFQGPALTMKGSPRWWDVAVTAINGADGTPEKLLSVSRDITASKEAEDRLRELNETLEARVADRTADLRFYRAIIEATASPICAFDTDYRLIAFNKAHSDEFFRIMGHRVQLGEVFPDLFPQDQAPTMRAFMARALAGERYSVVEEFGDPDLVKPYWEVIYTPIYDQEGRVSAAFHLANDITARLRAEEDLQAAQAALRQSQKMEAVGQLTGGLAHDFNNLLTGVTGSLELMQTRIAQGRIADVDRYINAAQGAAKRAAALTHRLLAFSRRQTLEPKPTDVNRLVNGMEELIRRTVGPEITVEQVGAAGLWSTLVDPGQLENALLNLCINARDAMPHGGRITIETGNRWMDERTARDRDLSPGQYVSLCVSDTGTGMAPEVIDKAFEPFFTTKPIGMGTGLGLSMIYGFAKQSGGQARIYSEVGQGAMVCLYLPRHLGDAVAPDLVADQAKPPRADAGQTVLVVDDEPTVRMLVAEVLEDLGYTAIEAADGAAGLKVLQSDIRLDLLVTDVGLPGGMNGRQVADAARTVRPNLKVLFITGYAENAVLSHGHLDPGMHVLTKPFAMESLATRIKDLLKG